MVNLKWIFALIAVLICVPLFGNNPAPPMCDAVTAATCPPDNPYETVTNLQAEIIYCEEMDFDGEWTPYEDVDLTWEPTPGGEETGYEIWVTMTPGNFEKLDTVKADKTEYTDVFISYEYVDVEIIKYKIRPVFDNRPGPFCEPVSVKNPSYITPIE